MGDLSKNLSRWEFACNCKCGLDTVDIKTVEIIQDVCDHFECSVNINSGCRCHTYNRAIGGVSESFHTKCRAGDCEFVGISVGMVYDYLIQKYPGKYGFGLYTWGIHIDTRSGTAARWEKG